VIIIKKTGDIPTKKHTLKCMSMGGIYFDQNFKNNGLIIIHKHCLEKLAPKLRIACEEQGVTIINEDFDSNNVFGYFYVRVK